MRGKLFYWAAQFFLFNLILALFIGLRYFVNPFQHLANAWSWGFILAYWIGHFALLTGIVFLLYLPLIIIFPIKNLHQVTLPLVAAVSLTLLTIDTFVYEQYRFHISKFVFDLFFKGHGQVISFAWQTWAIALSATVALFILELVIVKHTWCYFEDYKKLRIGRKVASFATFMFISSHVMHAIADGMFYRPVTSLGRLFPFSEPFNDKNFLLKYNLVNIEEYKKQSQIKIPEGEQTLNYPLTPVHCQPQPKNPMNILWIVVDALRYDMLDKTIMPNTYELGSKSQVFNRHMSGGNSTRYGVFSMFYGLPGMYFDSARMAHTTPIFMDQLRENNYQMGIFASAPLTMPEFDQTVFSKIENLRVKSQALTDYERDREITQSWIHFLDQRDPNQSFFGFLFYDSTHQYNFPPDYPQIFKPYLERVEYFKLNPEFDRNLLLNRFKIGAHFVDSLIGNVLQDLKKRGLDQNTVIMLTSDHGQEINDNGLNYWGHNSNFTDIQTRVPMVIYWPGMNPKVYQHLTSHYDLAATHLENILGCTADPKNYSSGHNLFKEQGHSWVLMGTYGNYAIYRDEDIIVVPYSGYYEVLDHTNRPVERPLDTQSLLEAVNEMRRFYK